VNKKRIAVLISGRGSNLQALAKAAAEPNYPAQIVTVISNRPEAPGLAWAKAQGLHTIAIDHKSFQSRENFEAALQQALDTADVELVVLAGFMRLMTPGFINRWRDRMINIHPSLLPSFKGLDTHARALAADVKLAGCTVHFVRYETDTGPIIAQAAVPVLSNDTPTALAERVLQAEHRLYPAALRLVASNLVMVNDEKAVILQETNKLDSFSSLGV
jgi:phosphoribosylglycinamide formyltransferase-1